MIQKYKKPGSNKREAFTGSLRGSMAPARGMGTRSGGGRGAPGKAPVILNKNQTYNQKFKIKKTLESTTSDSNNEVNMTDRTDLRNFIMEKSQELEELTVSANLAVPNNIGGTDSDEDIPADVHDHEIDDTDDTEEDERTGDMGIKPGSGSNDPNA